MQRLVDKPHSTFWKRFKCWRKGHAWVKYTQHHYDDSGDLVTGHFVACVRCGITYHTHNNSKKPMRVPSEMLDDLKRIRDLMGD